MASNEPAVPYEPPVPYEPGAAYEDASYESYEDASYERASYESYGHASYEDASYDPPLVPAYAPPYQPDPEPSSYDSEPYGAGRTDHERSYEPSAFSAFSFGAGRGRHRVVKQRGGTMARSGAVLGAGVIAAVGAGGMAHAQERPAAASISMPDLAQLPGVGSFFAGSAAGTADSLGEETGTTASEVAQEAAKAGEALRARIMEQADHQQGVAVAEAQAAQVKVAEAAQKQAAQRKAAEAEAARTAAAEAAEQKQAEQGRTQARTPERTPEKTEPRASEKKQTEKKQTEKKQAEKRERPGRASTRDAAPVRHSGAFTLPVGSYTLTAGFGQAGNMWSAHHTGEDFAAPTGTPVKAVGGGTITQAGWAGAYGYRIVLKLDDGTELWFCHLSSMVVTSGKVAAGQVIGRVGATGNVTGPHLHLEVRPGGGAPIDPLGWLRGRGLQP
ncbi:M23 family metallopeptidase [Streptomyces roseoverticillatus]|uniref:M23 family metallopeptidase n=1 Tax=Streptomyces roseoverticillatus TaxID=66429 RepID=UPI000A805F07|nr:M23 family metallopeptidase [Streptomyces roseoverticillatus]